MAITDELLARARALDSRAAEEIIAASYPAACRIARALTGEAEIGQRVARRVVQQSLQVMPRWAKGYIPEHWFYHHTLLIARQARQQFGPPSDAQKDLLVGAAEPRDMAYVAFIRALRQLPPQQLEAVLLHHGEHLNDRLLGVAMDCSAGAAANHLSAGTQSLRQVSGDGLDASLAALSRAYASLTPEAPQVRAEIRQQVKQAFWPRRLKRALQWVLALALIAASAYAAWRWRAYLAYLPNHLRNLRTGGAEGAR